MPNKTSISSGSTSIMGGQGNGIHVTHPSVLTPATQHTPAKPRRCWTFLHLTGVGHPCFECLTEDRQTLSNQSTLRLTPRSINTFTGDGQ